MMKSRGLTIPSKPKLTTSTRATKARRTSNTAWHDTEITPEAADGEALAAEGTDNEVAEGADSEVAEATSETESGENLEAREEETLSESDENMEAAGETVEGQEETESGESLEAEHDKDVEAEPESEQLEAQDNGTAEQTTEIVDASGKKRKTKVIDW